MSRFLNEKYRTLAPYTPGEQPTQRKYIKLNTNESPYPPSPSVIAAATAAAEKLMLYPDPECGSLRDALAARYGLSRENVFAANGSDDILYFSFAAFCGGDTAVVFPEISYGFYEVYARLYGVKYEKIPLREDFTIDPHDYTDKNGSLICIANPNAPTGAALSVDEVEQIVRSNPDGVTLIDEAYVDFGAQSSVGLIKKYENLIVVQTYSKSRSLAGARLGYAFAQPQLINDLERLKFSANPYSVNRMTLAAGEAALAERDYYDENCKKIMQNREFTAKKLREMDFTVIDSFANFLFAKSPDIDGTRLYNELKIRGILVRHFDDEKIEDFNRITIGTAQQMNALLYCIQQITGKDCEL